MPQRLANDRIKQDNPNSRSDALIAPIIVDNFLDYPEHIRGIALSSEYKDCNDHPLGGTWPGFRSDILNNILPAGEFDTIIQKVLSIFAGKGDYSIQSYFQICDPSDGESWIHQDIGVDYASILYLSPNPPKSSGTLLYRPVLYGYDPYHTTKKSNFIVDEVIDNKYNRLAIYDAEEFHSSENYFGDKIKDLSSARLTIVSFFRVKGVQYTKEIMNYV
jgi:hypothetical protein